jgi:protein-S-isoprenylcysteine O-methyltransferase Ste14
MARPGSVRAARRDRAVGWAFVAAQAALLIALVLTPNGTLWTVTGSVGVIGRLLIAAGLGLAGWAILSFGAGVTPSPVPSANATLVSSGPFRRIRHPMYTGVMAISVGITLRTASWTALALLAAIVVFFNVKARWEERRLVDTYRRYGIYRQDTGRFLPQLSRSESQRSAI